MAVRPAGHFCGWSHAASGAHHPSPLILPLTCGCAGTVILGAFEVPAGICDGPLPAFTIGADIILEAMERSVASATKSVLILGYGEQPVADGAGEMVETVWLMSVSQLQGGRRVCAHNTQRCRQCGVLLPYPGRDYCPLHAG